MGFFSKNHYHSIVVKILPSFSSNQDQISGATYNSDVVLYLPWTFQFDK